MAIVGSGVVDGVAAQPQGIVGAVILPASDPRHTPLSQIVGRQGPMLVTTTITTTHPATASFTVTVQPKAITTTHTGTPTVTAGRIYTAIVTATHTAVASVTTHVTRLAIVTAQHVATARLGPTTIRPVVKVTHAATPTVRVVVTAIKKLVHTAIASVTGTKIPDAPGSAILSDACPYTATLTDAG